MDLEEFNSAPTDRLRPALTACCDVPRWVDAILAKRPYDAIAVLTALADQVLRELDDDDVDRALRAHPRIGDRPRGASTEAAWSRSEQPDSTACMTGQIS